MNKVVVIYSGGLDSTVLLTQCKQKYDEVVALSLYFIYIGIGYFGIVRW